MMDLFTLQATNRVPPCIRSPENPNRSEDLMLWTLGHCNPRERTALLRAWTLGGSLDAPRAVEVATIAGLLGDVDE